MNRKKTLIILIGFAVFLFLVFLITLLFIIVPRPSDPHVTPPPTPPIQQQIPEESIQITQPPKSTDQLPIDPDSGAVNPENPDVKQSISELSKLEAVLPYRQELTLSNGEQVLLSISKNVLEETPWILPVYIGGLDFMVPEEALEYQSTKQSFKEAARHTLQFISSHGVDTSKIYIRWSDNPLEQEQLEQWIKE